MAGDLGPLTSRRQLRNELRALRVSKSMSIDQVTEIVEFSPSKLVRIEGGQVKISINDLNALLRVYGVVDPEAERLRDMARTTRENSWWGAYRKHLTPTYE